MTITGFRMVKGSVEKGMLEGIIADLTEQLIKMTRQRDEALTRLGAMGRELDECLRHKRYLETELQHIRCYK